jgi:hypothetical protein
MSTKEILLQRLAYELGLPSSTKEIPAQKILDHFLTKPVPVQPVQEIVLALQAWSTVKPTDMLDVDDLRDLQNEGRAISNYITQQLVQDHPADKRFVIRYLEQMCEHYKMNKHTAVGFSHDVIYSTEPLGESYKTFDNSLYVPPTKGYWAIVQRASSR